MTKRKDCPISPALIHLLQTCVTLGTTNSERLADALDVKPRTVRNEFTTILEALDVGGREGALLYALEKRWIRLNREIAEDNARSSETVRQT